MDTTEVIATDQQEQTEHGGGFTKGDEPSAALMKFPRRAPPLLDELLRLKNVTVGTPL